MRKIWSEFVATCSASFVLVAISRFLDNFGQGLLGGARINYFVQTLGLSGGQVLWLEGIREIPGLALMLIAALTMHWTLARRSAWALIIMGVGYSLYALVESYSTLLIVAVMASLGMHLWMPLGPALGMCLTTKERSGRILGALSSVGATAGIAGMGAISLISNLFADMSLRVYYVIGGVFIVLSGLILFRLPADLGATKAAQPRMLLKRRYWLFYVLNFLQGSRKEVLGSFVTLVLVQNYGLQVWQISSLLLISSILNLLAAPAMGYLIDHLGERAVVSGSYVFLALCCLGYATIHEIWVLVAILLTVRLLLMVGMGLNTYVNRIAPPEELTPTLSAGVSINHVTSVAMPLIAGVLLPIVGYENLFLATAGLLLFSVPFALAMKVPKPAVSQPSPAIAD